MKEHVLNIIVRLEQYYEKSVKRLIESINDDDDFIDPEEPLFHYDDEKPRYNDDGNIDPEEPLFHYGSEPKENTVRNSGPERFSGRDIAQCKERLYVNDGKILVTPLTRGKSFEMPVEECEFIVPIRQGKALKCWVNDSSGKRIGMTEMRI